MSVSYLLDETAKKVRLRARESAKNSDGELWCFLHSTLMDIAEYQGGDHSATDGDGFYKMLPDGEFDVNSAASYLEVALKAREEFLRRRSVR